MSGQEMLRRFFPLHLLLAFGLILPQYYVLADSGSAIFAIALAERAFSAIARPGRIERNTAYQATARRPLRLALDTSEVSYFARAMDPLAPFSAIASSAYGARASREGGWRVSVSQRYGAQYAINTGTGNANKVDLLAQPTFRVETPGGLRFTATARARLDAFDTLDPGREKSSELSRANRPLQIGDRLDLELRELYVDAKLGKADLRLGKQITKWGNAQGFKVLDIVNPIDFREFILEDDDDAKIPLLSGSLTLPFSETTRLKTVWVLDPSFSNIPPEDTGATFDLTSVLLMPMVPKNLPFPVIVKPFDRPARNIRDSDVGFEFQTMLAGANITLNYLYHYDDVTVGFVNPPTGPGTPLIVNREFKRTSLFGGSAARFFGPLQLRAEAAYDTKNYLSNTDPRDPEAVTKFGNFQYVLGADFVGLKDTILSFQVQQSRITREDRFLERDRNETNLSFFVQRQLTPALSFRTILLRSFNRADGLIRPRFTYATSKNTSMFLGADVFYGERRGIYGQFKEQDQIVLGININL